MAEITTAVDTVESISHLQADVLRVAREDHWEELVGEAVSAVEHDIRPSCEIRMRPLEESKPWRWGETMGTPCEDYLNPLLWFDIVTNAKGNDSRLGEDDELNLALRKVLDNVNVIGAKGWNVNWRQNVQYCLRRSRYGLSGKRIADRFKSLADETTLLGRLELIGSTIFHVGVLKQDKVIDVAAVALTIETERMFGQVVLNKRELGRRYASARSRTPTPSGPSKCFLIEIELLSLGAPLPGCRANTDLVGGRNVSKLERVIF